MLRQIDWSSVKDEFKSFMTRLSAAGVSAGITVLISPFLVALTPLWSILAGVLEDELKDKLAEIFEKKLKKFRDPNKVIEDEELRKELIDLIKGIKM